jgi:protein-S-isoprenylcysteine O-methyltransferase
MVTVKQDHELILRGPYAVVRHPIYSGLLLALTGTAIAVGEIRAFEYARYSQRVRRPESK